jgi:hypothetical protein
LTNVAPPIFLLRVLALTQENNGPKRTCSSGLRGGTPSQTGCEHVRLSRCRGCEACEVLVTRGPPDWPHAPHRADLRVGAHAGQAPTPTP